MGHGIRTPRRAVLITGPAAAAQKAAANVSATNCNVTDRSVQKMEQCSIQNEHFYRGGGLKQKARCVMRTQRAYWTSSKLGMALIGGCG